MHHVDFDDMPVADIMRRWPATIAIFLELELNCIGCPIGPFHTVADAAEEHGIPLEELNRSINRVISDRPKAEARRSSDTVSDEQRPLGTAQR